MAKRRKRQSGSSNSGIDALKRQIQATGLLKDGWRVATDIDGPKLSAVLLEFIKPYKKDDPTREVYDKLITMAVVSWNAALQDGEERQKYIHAMVDMIINITGEEWRKEAESIIQMMIKRKERYFAEDNRHIVDFCLTETSQEYHLSVASFIKS
jgi:hypothetical protein